jgi:hypothetical protein
LLEDGEVVDPPPLVVAGRTSQFWVHVPPEGEWSGRVLTIRMELWADGQDPVWSGELTHTLDPDWVGGYSFHVPDGVLSRESELVLHLFDADDQPISDFPVAGRYPLYEAVRPARLALTFQPLTWQADDCGATPDVGAERLALYEERLQYLLPVESLDVVVLDPVEWTEPVESLAPVVEFLEQRRADLDLPPHRLYVGLLDPCAEQIGGRSALARDVVPDASPEHANLRVAAVLSNDPDTTADRLVHETGHLLGRKHVRCVDESDPDPDYPYSGSTLPHRYFDIRTDDFVDDLHEVMSYCRPYGTSDYGWGLFSEMIEGLTALGSGALTVGPRVGPRAHPARSPSRHRRGRGLCRDPIPSG